MNKSTSYIYGILALLGVLLVLPGCEEAHNSRGSFSMNIAGDINKNLEGNAVFGGATDPKTHERGFALILTTGKTNAGNRLSGEALYLATLQSGRPEPGTYDIVNPDASPDRLDASFWGYVQVDEEPYVTFVTWDGSITIETSTEDKLSGTFEMEARGYDLTLDPIKLYGIELSGEFTSEGGYVYIPEL